MGKTSNRQVRRIIVSGYYGFNNSGDEAVLKSILNALHAEGEAHGITIEPVVLSADPAWTTKMYGVEAVPRMSPSVLLREIRRCDGLISGGGSLLQDATGWKTIPYYTGVLSLAQMLGKPTFIYSQGVGPVNRGWLFAPIRRVMNKSKYISVRDAESAALLGRIGVAQERVEIVPDPVMGLPLPAGADEVSTKPPSGDALPVVGVSLRHWRKDGADLERAASALAALAKRRAVRFRFLPFHMPDDAATSQIVIDKMRMLGLGESSAELASPGDDPQQMLLEVSRCDMMFGMRLHALIYAANQRVPLIGLSYDPKINQFLNRLGLTPIGTTEQLDPVQFAASADSLLSDLEGWRTRHGEAIDRLKRESQRPAQQIAALLSQTMKR
ncbi:polysaccharide pyruvyl transferase CsaB [Paenibacillus cellulosilyticus]|uniref:Polysaccharide pyruvyl transferase CsaB n=1 Tax=Paenibacillus cellulosilyticus TaxID=375489 RepID=A0A2V2Z0J8_9BACL|nr:polysaccharide pyruvyl transferase CsaB [Paenibacillus cellulosilyticus]PWW08377.1 polysaccharide pyruvyl transferase CsaB [Paenibacillus cellulosilyticus]QKS47971.1 polysaccharide pyruvyl transferase CsaB [Paenibacillus cellulosilyticus]